METSRTYRLNRVFFEPPDCSQAKDDSYGRINTDRWGCERGNDCRWVDIGAADPFGGGFSGGGGGGVG